MEFFEHQEQARRRTWHLVLLFGAAVVGIVGVTHILVVAIFGHPAIPEALDSRLLWNPELIGSISLGTLLVVGGGTLFKVSQLSGGGYVVAESLGGRLLDSGSADPVERKILNVVEEMAIASGVSVPPVYLLDAEAGINAFAAGYSPEDAVIGVTRGCVEHLTRDQLQGVMAHEFSHILNGDMRLNIRLMGVLHGILVIGLIGYYVLRAATSGTRHRSQSRRNEGNPLPLIGLGAGLMAIGYIGTFFGNVIKAAVSRQREFLADASAVQFTRNPDGIAGALKAMGRLRQGSRLETSAAAEASHLFFGQGVGFFLNSLFATHPPLAQRIRRIDPSWDGKFDVEQTTTVLPKKKETQSGSPGFKQLRHSILLLAALQENIRQSSQNPFGARAVVYALVLQRDQRGVDWLRDHADPAVFDETERLLPSMSRLPVESRLPLIDLSLPSLRRLSPEQYQLFRDNLRKLMLMDELVDLFEWCLTRTVLHVLDLEFGISRRKPIRYKSLRRVESSCVCLLASLAYVGHADGKGVEEAFLEGLGVAGLQGHLLPRRDELALGQLDQAMDILEQLSPMAKKRLVESCSAVVQSDATINVEEYELLRAVCDSLACPLPPFTQ